MDLSAIRKAEQTIAQRHLNASMRLNREISAMFEENPELKELDLAIRAAACDFSRTPAEKAAALKAARDAFDAYLLTHHLTMPKARYVCEKCQDTGVLPDGSRCSCFTRLLIAETLADDPLLREQTFEKFDLSLFSGQEKETMAKFKEFCEAYCAKFPDVKKANMILTGATGTGKTFLLSSVASALKSRGFSVVFLTAGKLFDLLRKYAFNQSNDIDVLLEADALFIDDLGTEPLFNHITLEYTFMLVNERTRTKKPLLITTNLTPDELKERYTERISSRLLDRSTTNILHLSGHDLRMRPQ